MEEIFSKEALEASMPELAAIKGLKEITRLMNRTYTIMDHVRVLLDLPVDTGFKFADGCLEAAAMVERLMGTALFAVAQKDLKEDPEEDAEILLAVQAFEKAFDKSGATK